MANPPFNIKDWARNPRTTPLEYGVPPAGNANYAWIQHIISKLAPGGSAGVVMANGSMSSNSGGEGEIRAQIVEADLVACMVALPTQLFRSTGIPVCLWFFAKDKTAGTQRLGRPDRAGALHRRPRTSATWSTAPSGRCPTRTSPGSPTPTTPGAARASAAETGLTYEDVPGFCKSATLAEIKAADYALTPGRYVGAAEVEDDGEPIEEKIERLTKELFAQFDESARLETVVREQLERLDV